MPWQQIGKGGDRKRNLLLLTIVLFVGSSLSVIWHKQSITPSSVALPINAQPLTFPFTHADEHGSVVFIAPEHYNQKNLHELFLWRYRQWLKTRGSSDLRVFTDERSLNAYLEGRRKAARIHEYFKYPYAVRKLIDLRDRIWPTLPPAPTKRRWSSDAELSLAPSEPLLFGTEDKIDSRGFNVSYIFAPDLARPNIRKEVVLRGATWREGKYNVQTKEFPWQERKINWASYDIYNVEPRGRYHTFSITRQIRGQESPRIIFHILPGGEVPASTGGVKLLNDQVAYVYLGWRYSVTVDGGLTWHLWDAERELSGWNCCDAGLIKRVEMSPQGEGVLTLKSNSQRPDDVLLLRTRDFGQRWE